jgi:hypothetical protein
MTFPIYGNLKNVPNHQSVRDDIGWFNTGLTTIPKTI